MASSWTKMVAVFEGAPGLSLSSFSSVLIEMKHTYDVGYSTMRRVGDRYSMYFQTVGGSKMTKRTVESICGAVGTIRSVERYTAIEGEIVGNEFGKFRRVGGSKPRGRGEESRKKRARDEDREEGGIKEDRITSDERIITLNVKPVGSEITSHITAGELQDMIIEIVPDEVALPRIELVVAFGRKMYETTARNSNIVASSKDSHFKTYDGDMWRVRRVSTDFSKIVFDIWSTKLLECTNQFYGTGEISEKTRDLVRDSVGMIRDGIDPYWKEFNSQFKREAMVVFGELTERIRAMEDRNNKKVKRL